MAIIDKLNGNNGKIFSNLHFKHYKTEYKIYYNIIPRNINRNKDRGNIEKHNFILRLNISIIPGQAQHHLGQTSWLKSNERKPAVLFASTAGRKFISTDLGLLPNICISKALQAWNIGMYTGWPDATRGAYGMVVMALLTI